MVEGLYEVSEALVSAAAGPLEAALDVLCTFLELRAASLAVFQDDGAIDIAFDSSSKCHGAPALVPLAREAARSVKATRMPLVVESVSVELPDLHGVISSCLDGGLDVSLVGVPVKADGGVIGSLAIVREHSAGDQADFCFDADIRVLGSVANLIGLNLRVRRLGAGDGANASPARTAPAIPVDDPLADANQALVGTAVCWRATLRRAQIAAKTNATVLLRGETGTGKNVVARLVHDASDRRDRSFVVLNCAAPSETLLESELFGHEKGSFTGATCQRKGRFELADGGTLFLDEIGEISPAFQAKLLRVLQVGEFERVGGTTTCKVDVRIIAATHRNLEDAVREGSFRADLYYRLCVVPIHIPSLRQRPDDIPQLARAFLGRFNTENRTQLALGETAVAAMMHYSFPGNVRELENAIRRAATLSERRTLMADDFSFLGEANPTEGDPPSLPLSSDASPSQEHFEPQPTDLVAGNRLVDRNRLVEALERTGWVLAKAARILGMTPRQIGYAVQKHRIAVRKY
jgi:Nif-specific regulatory protein